MKIALLVFPIHYSHGNILQTYALYTKLKEIGHDVIILNRQPPRKKIIEQVLDVVSRLIRTIKGEYHGAIFYQGTYPRVLMRNLWPFLDNFCQDIITIYSTKELKQKVIRYHCEAIVVGSDQVWRPKYVTNVMDYWLDFACDLPIRKVAYAPSFGTEVWEYEDSQRIKCRKLSKLFCGLSVREQDGIKLCKKYLGINAVHVVDPTLLWDSSFYTTFANRYPMSHGQCQCYFLDHSSDKSKIANQVSTILHLPLNYINTHTENSDAPVKERIAPSIEKWLSGFMKGAFIITDSFHAMVFSIIYHKPFITIGNSDRGLSRFNSLLHELKLTDRLFTSFESIEKIIKKDINWIDVDRRIDIHRQKSITFLIESLEKKHYEEESSFDF